MSETIGLCFIIDQYFKIKKPKFYIFNWTWLILIFILMTVIVFEIIYLIIFATIYKIVC